MLAFRPMRIGNVRKRNIAIRQTEVELIKRAAQDWGKITFLFSAAFLTSVQ